MIYFDNAATTFPKPVLTREAAGAAFTRYGANPGRGGHTMAIETAQMVYRAREGVARLLHFDKPENVIFTLNCTQGINQAVKGVLRMGDHVVISSLEHNAVYRPLEALRRAGMITLDIAPVDTECPENTVRAFEACMTPKTRLVCCIHGSNVFGTLQPAERLCALAHEHGALFLLDAAQTAGLVDIDMSGALPADFVCLACHKGLYAPTALGALVVGTDTPICTLLEGGSGSLSLEAEMPPFLPDRLEAGTVNTTGIAGLLGGLQFLRRQPRLYENEMTLTHFLFDKLARIPDVILYRRPALPVFSFGIRDMTGEAVADALARRGFALRGGFHCSPLAHRAMGTIETGTARVSLGAFNTMPQVQALLRAVDTVRRTGQ